MNAFTSVLPLAVAAPVVLGGCVGLHSGVDYPDYDSSWVSDQLLTSEYEPNPGISLGDFRVRDEVCEGIDTHTVTTTLGYDDLSRFLASQGVQDAPVMARGNLYWYELPGDDDGVVRLRLAVLDNAQEAGKELHHSLLEHGPGWWGLRRSNLAVLAPRAGVTEAIAFALKYKLVCWGAFAMADADDVYVVPGPYAEL